MPAAAYPAFVRNEPTELGRQLVKAADASEARSSINTVGSTDFSSSTITPVDGDLDLSGGQTGWALLKQPNGSLAMQEISVGAANVEDVIGGVRVDDGFGGLGTLRASLVEASLVSPSGNSTFTVGDLWVDSIHSNYDQRLRFRSSPTSQGVTLRPRQSNGEHWLQIGDKDGTDNVRLYVVGPKAGTVQAEAVSTPSVENLSDSIEVGNVSYGSLAYFQSGASDPTALEIPAGTSAIYKNITSGEIRQWANDGGTLYKSAALIAA